MWFSRSRVSVVRFIGGAIFLCTLLMIGGCAGSPQPISTDFSSLLFSEGEIYIRLEPARDFGLTRKILDTAGMDEESLEKLLERTEIIHGSFRTVSDGMYFNILSTGRYPDFSARLSLRFSDQWSRKKGDYPWWENNSTGIQLAFLGNEEVCISNGDMDSLLKRISSGPRKQLPLFVQTAMERSAMSVYASHPVLPSEVPPVFREVEELRISLNRLVPSTDAKYTDSREMYRIDGIYRCGDIPPARSLYLLLRLQLLSELGKTEKGRDYGKLMENDPVILRYRTVVLRGYPISSDRLEWFFSIALPFTDSLVERRK